MITFDLRRLRLLLEVEERGTFAAAAAALGYTPSAISQQLAILEREAGAPLFAKAGRGVRMTDAGRLLARHAQAILAEAESAQAALAALGDEVRGTVRASGLQSGTRRLLIPAVARVMTEHPLVRVEVSEIELEQALPLLRLGDVDFAISDEYDGHPRPRPDGLVFELLLEEPLLLALPASHPRARRRGAVDITALRDAVWGASDVGTGHHAAVLNTCRSLGGFEPDLRYTSNDANVQLELVRLTGAVALLPGLTLPPAADGVVIRDVAGVTISRRLVAVMREGARSPALSAFATAVADEARRL